MSDNVVLLQRPGAKVPTHTERFGDSWVILRKFQTIGDRSAIQQATVTGKIIAKTGTDEVEMGELKLGAAPLQTLIQHVMDWGGPAFCREDHAVETGTGQMALEVPVGHVCTPTPITPLLLDGLYNGPAQIMLKLINDWNPDTTRGNSQGGDGGKNSTAYTPPASES